MKLLCLLASACLSWSGESHVLVAHFAKTSMKSSQYQWITRLFDMWPSESGNLMNISNWHDMILGSGANINLMSQWHFQNSPYVSPGYDTVLPNPKFNITDAIRMSIETIMNPTTTSVWALSMSFRNLVHFVGDVHCPVHSIDFYSHAYPRGDKGGNARYLTCSYGYFCTNLHKLWDSAVLDFQENKYNLANNPDFYYNSTKLKKEYPESYYKDKLKIEDPLIWSKESYDVAVKYAYGNLVNEVEIHPAYIKAGAPWAHERVAIAGHRLSRIYNAFFQKRGLPRLEETHLSARLVIVWAINCVCLVIIVAYLLLGGMLKSIFNQGFSYGAVKEEMI